MADKEERIYILSKPLYPSVDGWKEAKENSMTRQEAIEKIKNASAFYLSHKLGCTKEEEAEYILNALLKGVKK